MKRIVLPVAVFLFSAIFIYSLRAQNFAKKPQEKISLSEPQKSLVKGETLEYSVEWLGIPSGVIIFNVVGTFNYKGRECYYLKFWARLNNFFARFYDVEYNIESFVDVEHFYPYYYIKRSRYRNKLCVETIEFDRLANTAKTTIDGITEDLINSSLKNKVKQPRTSLINEKSLDPLSAIYFLRLQDIALNQETGFFIYHDRSNWQVSVKSDAPYLRDLRRIGTLAIIELTPQSSLTGFVFGKNNANIYLTPDSRRIPVEFSANTAIGFIRARIKKIPN
ncbi:MAG: DUF3108 domain-containing protein [Candidatus Omnitrophota bacterium]